MRRTVAGLAEADPSFFELPAPNRGHLPRLHTFQNVLTRLNFRPAFF